MVYQWLLANLLVYITTNKGFVTQTEFGQFLNF